MKSIGKSARQFSVPAILVVALSSCYQMPELQYATNDHLKKTGEARSNGKAYFAEYDTSFNDKSDAAKAYLYVQAGAALTEGVCTNYLNDLRAAANNQEFFNKQLGITTVLTTGVLAIAGAHTDAFEALALGTAFTLSTSDNFRDHYLLGPDSENIVKLVEKSMAAVLVEIKKRPPSNFYEAYHQLRSYSKVCSVAEIRRLVGESIIAANPEASSQGAVAQRVDQIIRNSIASNLLGVATLTDRQMTGLYWLTVRGTGGDAQQISIITELLGPVLNAAVSGNLVMQVKIRDEFQRMTAPTLAEFKTVVQKHIDEIPNALSSFVAGGPSVEKLVVNAVPPTNPIATGTLGGSGTITVRIK
ncbi:MAG: hypothetical protein RH946_00260 [Rhodospirillales bacterium]